MLLGIIVAFAVLVLILVVRAPKTVNWSVQLTRLHAGAAGRAEWMAPEQVIEAVKRDYMQSLDWIGDSVFYAWSQQWRAAGHYLSGEQLRYVQAVLASYRRLGGPRFVGVMRCTHIIEVRNFSEDGERCYVIDRQGSRRMATYHYWTRDRVGTQDLGDAIVIYEMAFDRLTETWKLDRLVQELPAYWSGEKAGKHLRFITHVPPTIGRDH